MHEDLHNFFQSAFTFVRDRLKHAATMAEIASVAEAVLADLRLAEGPITWETATRVTIAETKRTASLMKPVRVVGFIGERSEPRLVTVQGPDGVTREGESLRIVLRDRYDERIQTLDVVGRTLVDEITFAARAGGPVEVLGLPVALPGAFTKIGPADTQRGFYLFVADIRRSFTHLDLLGADDEERQSIGQYLDRLTWAKVNVVTSCRQQLAASLGIVGLEDFPLLADLLDFTVLQALSCGSIGHAPGRLHLLLVGPPAQGKKLVGLAARVLNPTYGELSPSKASPAGLVGASAIAKDGWTSTPGLLARAAHGVALLQDAHAWKKGTVDQLGPVLQEVIEDGVVRDAVAGGVTRPATAALLIDLNRTAQLGGASGSEAPILCLRPLLSRVDVIAEIHSDIDRAWKTGAEMYEALAQKPKSLLDDQPWVKELRLLICTLRDRHPHIDLTSVTAMMKEVHQRIWSANVEKFQYLPEAGDIPTRLAISFARLVSAQARSADRDVAIEDDVQAVTKFIEMKLSFLALRGPELEAAPAQQQRREWVKEEAEKGAVNPADLARRYQQETGDFVSTKTIRRDLERMGAKKRGVGMYYLPTSGDDPLPG